MLHVKKTYKIKSLITFRDSSITFHDYERLNIRIGKCTNVSIPEQNWWRERVDPKAGSTGILQKLHIKQ